MERGVCRGACKSVDNIYQKGVCGLLDDCLSHLPLRAKPSCYQDSICTKFSIRCISTLSSSSVWLKRPAIRLFLPAHWFRGGERAEPLAWSLDELGGMIIVQY